MIDQKLADSGIVNVLVKLYEEDLSLFDKPGNPRYWTY